MGTKIPSAQKRLFANIFICKNCRHRMRTQATRVLAGKVRCRKCGKKAFRAIKKK